MGASRVREFFPQGTWLPYSQSWQPIMQPWALAALSGFLYYLAIPPRAFTLPAWICLLPVLWACRDSTPRRALKLGWLAGTLANLGAYSFMYRVISTHSAIPGVGAALVVLVMAAQQGLGTGLWLALCRFLDHRTARWLLYPTLYVAIEFIYPLVFPLHLGNCQHACLITSQWMDLAGPAGLTFVIVSLQISVWSWAERRRGADRWVGLALLAAVLVYGPLRISQVSAQMQSATEHLKVAVVQNNVGTPRRETEMITATLLLQQMARTVAAQDHPDLIVFPETAIKTPPPAFTLKGESLIRSDPTLMRYPVNLSFIDQRGMWSPQAGYQVPLLFGCVAEDLEHDGPIKGRRARHNAAFLVDAQGNVLGHAFKNKLLLVGEYIPGAAYVPWLYTHVLTRASVLTPGRELAVLDFQGKRLGISICYEDILVEKSHQLAQKKPHLLVNLTNDGWFGNSAEPPGHLALARARCIELRRFMVRSTSTGVSAFIDPLGRVVKQSHVDAAETLVEKVSYLEGGTVFCWVGPYFAWLCTFVSGVWLAQSWRARRLSTSTSPSDPATAARVD